MLTVCSIVSFPYIQVLILWIQVSATEFLNICLLKECCKLISRTSQDFHLI